MKKPTMLMILDGFGFNPEADGNAIAAAKTPNLDMLAEKYPHTTLGASGLCVGLPDGQMGNSEVGHMNIGAGRIIYQELTRITKEIQDGTFFDNQALSDAMDHVVAHNSALHVMGLLSDGGVHSHITHLMAIIDMAKKKAVSQVYVHGFLDGRDVPPRCAEIYIKQLEDHMAQVGLGKIAMISGRYYAMDRDNRWERVVKAYDALTLGQGETASSALEALAKAYDRDENDEFVLPTVIMEPSAVCDCNPVTPGCRCESPAGLISDNDSVIMFNFRPDRAREITRTFVDDDFSGFERKARPANIKYVCMTQYDASMPNVTVAFPPQKHTNTLGEYVSKLGKNQIRIAETEKYAHVTFFFNGGVEAPNPAEDRILIPSPEVATYDLQPEMSAYKVKDAALDAIRSGKYDLIIMNFANPDMVGHTGIFDAAVAAVEAVDLCVGEIAQAIAQAGGSLFITADHGNADTMIDSAGNVITAHSTNRVPAILMTPAADSSDSSAAATDTASSIPAVTTLREDGLLADIAPTLLALMGLEQPAEMTGKSLIK